MKTTEIAGDLAAEQQELDVIVSRIPDADWEAPTPSPRWAVRDQIAHLAYFDETAVVAITDPIRFADHVSELGGIMAEGPGAVDDATIGPMRTLPPASLLDRWRAARASLAEAASGLDGDTRVNWYGPAMSANSFLTARLMETWAHGQDVVDALGVRRQPTNRLRHIARLGYLTRSWSYLNRGLMVPEGDVFVQLQGPYGDRWVFGQEEAAESVSGPAEHFCLVVTQRRHLDDTELHVTPGAREWLLIAQAFAGGPTEGPEPGSRP